MLNDTLMCGLALFLFFFLSSPFEEYLWTPHTDLMLNVQVLSAAGSFLNKTHEPFIPETLRSGESPQKIMIQLGGISSWEVKDKPHQKRYWRAFCLCWERVSLAMVGAGAQLCCRGRGSSDLLQAGAQARWHWETVQSRAPEACPNVKLSQFKSVTLLIYILIT